MTNQKTAKLRNKFDCERTAHHFHPRNGQSNRKTRMFSLFSESKSIFFFSTCPSITSTSLHKNTHTCVYLIFLLFKHDKVTASSLQYFVGSVHSSVGHRESPFLSTSKCQTILLYKGKHQFCSEPTIFLLADRKSGSEG